VAGHELVERVEEGRGAEGPQRAPERAHRTHFEEQSDAASGIARDGRAVPEDEPPALVARVIGHRREQTSGFLVGQRQQRQLFTSVELGDDPRRPPTELSGAGVEQNWAPQPGIHVADYRTAVGTTSSTTS
jgi:hypothetical protein